MAGLLTRRPTPDRIAEAEARLTEQIDVLSEQLAGEGAVNDLLRESLAALELQLDEIGWARLSMESDWEFSREGLDRIIALSRLNVLKNPLIRRGVHLKADYVFGQGLEISARDADVNDVVQAFLDDPGNAKVLFGDVALPAKDRALTTDGALALVLFPNRLTGHVQVRPIDALEVRDIIVNPDDAAETWFYLRRWTERRWALDGASTGGLRTAAREAWYPDWRYLPVPGQRHESIDRIPVRWDSPLYYVPVGGLDGMRFGLPETYAALDWAKAYKLFLEDWATIVRALSRFAFQLTGSKNPTGAAARLGTQYGVNGSPVDANPAPATASTFVARDGVNLQAIPKTDATVSSGDGVWLAKMVGAALGFPYTILMGDPDMGNHATAKTLDRPTELTIEGRQRLWKQVLSDLAGYQVDWAIRAPGGALHGTEVVGQDGRRRLVLDDVTTDDGTVTGLERRTVDVAFPPLEGEDVDKRIKAIVTAASTELPDDETILRLLLIALGVDDVDELVTKGLEQLEARKSEAGQVAVDRLRQGLDPAEPLGDDEDEGDDA